MPDIVLYDKNGQPVIYEGVDSLSTDTPVAEEIAKFTYGDLLEGVQVEPYLKNGNQTITVPEGFLVREATILKPESLKPENIKKYETVAGVEGSFIGNQEEAEVKLDMENGDQVVFPTSEDVLISKVTIKKPDTMTPNNIVKDVVIGGVKGSFEGIRLDNLEVVIPISEITVPDNYDGMVPIMNPIGLKSGQIYLVMWNNTGYVCTAQSTEFEGLPVVALGNSAAWGGDDTGEPFAVGEFPEEVVSQTGGVYGGIIPLDGSTTFTAGGYFIGSDGSILDGFSVDLDFSGGEDQKVDVPDGYLLKKATIVKPETLVPESIVKGVNVAGVEGTFEDQAGALIEGTLSGMYYNATITSLRAGVFGGLSTYNFGVSFPNCSIISTYAFSGATSLTSVFLESCESVPNYAFINCKSLKDVSIPLCSSIGYYAFSGCTNLGELNFPICTTISSSAFNFASISKAVFPQCTTIKSYAFKQCSVTSMSFPECTTIEGSAFYSCYRLTSAYFPKCTTIGTSAFMACNSLKSVDFPLCTTIPTYAFYQCPVTSVSFPKAKTVNMYAFYWCRSLSEIDLPECTTVNNAFISCTALQSVNMPKLLTASASAFERCTKLTHVNLPVCTIAGSSAFYMCALSGEVNIPNLLAAYPNAFANTNIRKVYSTTFPNLTTIHSSAFRYCYALSYVYAPAATSIGSSAFANNSKMATVSLPAVTNIYTSAFYSCIGLKSLYLLGSSYVTLTNSLVFGSTPLSLSSYLGEFGSIFFRESMLATYKTSANWSVYSARMVGLTDDEIAALEVPE